MTKCTEQTSILIVEDDDTLREALGDTLSLSGVSG